MTEAIIGALGTIIGAVIGALGSKVKGSKESVPENLSGIRLMNDRENPCALVTEVPRSSFFSVNAYTIYNFVKAQIMLKPHAVINDITIVVRKKPDENQRDLAVLKQVIENWHALVTNGKIKKLKIVSTPHDINHYYAVMGTKQMFLGLVMHDDNLPTGTDVDYQPIFFSGDSEIGREMILKYQGHFNNVVARFEGENTLYDSEDPSVFRNISF